MWVLEGTAASTLPTTHPVSVAESFLHVGDVVVRRVAQVFDSFGEERVLHTPASSPISEPRKLRR